MGLTMTYQFAPYDVLQVQRDGQWLDFSTIRTTGDAVRAEEILRAGWWNGEGRDFRIVDPSKRNVKIATTTINW